MTSGFLPAAPAGGACGRCEFVQVCGPHEARRAARKIERAHEARLHDLQTLREMR
jgi:hypothetical protein